MQELNAILYEILDVGILLFLLQDRFFYPVFFLFFLILATRHIKLRLYVLVKFQKSLLYCMHLLQHYNPRSRFQTLIPVNRPHMAHRHLAFRLTVHPAAVVFSRVGTCMYYVAVWPASCYLAGYI